MTTGAYAGLDIAESLFYDAVWTPLLKTAVAAMYAYVPWLAVWPLGPLLNFAISKLSDQLFAGLKLVVDLQAIAFVNQAHQTAFNAAALKLQVVGHDSGENSDAFIKAKADALAALSQFVHVPS